MIRQTILPYKLESTNDTITPHAGLILFGEFVKGLRLEEKIDERLPGPGSGRGYRPSEFIFPELLKLCGGGRSLEDTRVIREDMGLRDILGLERIPSPDATGDWLRRIGDNSGLDALAAVERYVVHRALKYDGLEEYTLDIDATGIESEKKTALRTYKGYTGYMPMLGHLAENSLVIGDDFRRGNKSPHEDNLEFIMDCERQMPEGKRISHVRADAASYQAEIFNYCEDNNMQFAIGAHLKQPVVELIQAIGERSWKPYRDGHIATAVYCMEKTNKAFTLVIKRNPIQGDLFDEVPNKQRYKVIATNFDLDKNTPEEILDWYNQRGEHSENRIKELKCDFCMERMPCGTLRANAVFFRIGVLTYNLYAMFRTRILPREYSKARAITTRWRLFNLAGKVADHARSLTLRVSRLCRRLFEAIRLRVYEYCMEDT